MLLKKSSDYALQLGFYLSQESGDNYIHLKQIAEKLDFPYYQLSKIANLMVQKGILKSRTGPNGGVCLKMNPKELSLWDIIQPFEGDSLFENCVLGMAKCDDKNPCPIHEFWKNARNVLQDLFKAKSLEELSSTTLQELSAKNLNT
ncbi:MAG: RrF2 family transcriptional regulator [Fidelibacterota bacterium]